MQNCAALGAIIEFSIDAMMRLSVFTTDIGRVLDGVYAGLRASVMLDCFLGIKYSKAWLKFGGGGKPFGSIRLLISAWKSGSEIK